MVSFFINRPIFSWVIAITIMLAGGLSILNLPIAQYPRIAPVAVEIDASFPGASAKTIEDTVTQVIEQKMNGIDHLRYMTSTSDSAGNAAIILTFDSGTDPDIAQVQVQNKLQLATPLLPQEVQQQGIRVVKSVKNYLMIVSLISTDGTLTRNDLSDYIAANMQDRISRINGVGDIQLFGSQYAMRVWVNPHKLNSYNLTIQDVSDAISVQNNQIIAGQIGGTPTIKEQQLNAPIIAQTRLQSSEEFGKILLKVNTDGSQVRLKDVARIELGGESYENISFINDNPAGALAIRLTSDANALKTAEAIRNAVKEMSAFFPPNVEVRYPYDTTPFIQLSIEEVVKTLVEAIILVFLVMWLFLQNIRATLIPTIAIPVVLLGTFGILAAFGYSINTLTMFGVVLAIGLLVDDAIVVVENVERVMREENLSPKAATEKSMKQITGALIGIGLVLSAVFVPMAFFSGSVGVIYKQFSLTIVSAMGLSVLIALIFTPALCASILKSEHASNSFPFFEKFNHLFSLSTQKYQQKVEKILNHQQWTVSFYGALLIIATILAIRLPTAFLPEEDQGFMFTQAILPPGATQERTLKVLQEAKNYYLTQEKDAVESVLWVVGVNFSGRGQNTGLMFVKMKDWKSRKSSNLKVQAVAQRASAAFSKIKDGMVIPFVPPAVLELGNATGFDLELQDNAGLGHQKLLEARNKFLSLAAQNSLMMHVRPNGLDDVPYYHLKVDQEKASAYSLSLKDINQTLSLAWGSSYVNDFIDRGRVKKVYLQGDAPYRMLPSDLEKWYVRNQEGKMVSFANFSKGEWIFGSPRLERFNGLSAVEILGEPTPGHSTGEAMKAIKEIMHQLPAGINLAWTGISFEEQLSGAQAPILYMLSLIVVFLSLAALYESWTIPFSVILAVPLGVFGALLAATLRGLPNDVYFQVGLLTTMGLSTKNAILIVEFAKELYAEGLSLFEATLKATKIRLRPIIMTSLAFTLGVVPLFFANGAGSGSQIAIGTGVLGGVLAATFLGIFFIPLFFFVVITLSQKRFNLFKRNNSNA
ncbi:MAG: efflux RND transporter permease subunit [Candidatus Paracaedimonas acanthamoebae]|uniref:Efflux pump membrane transporter n=1 Tax=Candidatus Paracaedimonas acanthamoebae TaxID=244581 RepID=A0A8J7TUN6_9PROT|nr:efflux RND transporter permease subunit [Candidatus Paracaedimonas acanthamoebae]